MIDFLANSEICSLSFTFLIYFLALKLNRRYTYFFFNPVLITTACLILLLKITGISFEAYNKGGHYISFLLKPAVVALGVPLYLQLEEIRKQKAGILLSQLAGCVIGIVSVVFFAKLFGASKPVILSLVPKSVTSPIAMEISKTIGGIPSLTVGIVISVGIFGAIAGVYILKLFNVKDDLASGLSFGTAAHGLGTAKAAEISSKHAAFGGLGMILNAILTALIAPWIVKLLDHWIS
jgi:predicted murein hydrolase (TIGR00659 family)